MKKFKSIIVFILAISLAICSFGVLKIVGAIKDDPASALSLNTALVRVEIVDANRRSYITADKDGNVDLYINALDDIPDGVQVSVYYRTIDATAVGGKDFTAVPTVYGTNKDTPSEDVSGKVILTKENPQKMVEIKTNYVSYGVQIDGVQNVPFFEVEIYKVVNARATSRSDMKCYLNVERWLVAKTTDSSKYGGNGYVFEEYLSGDRSYYGNSGIMDTDPGDEQYPDWFVLPKMSNSSRQSKWTNDYINTGIADPYITFTCHIKGGGNGNEHFYISDDFGDWTTQTYKKKYNEPWINFNTTKVHINQDEIGIRWNDDVVFSGITKDKLFEIIDKAANMYYNGNVPSVALNRDSAFKTDTKAKNCTAIPNSVYNYSYLEGVEGAPFIYFFDNDWVSLSYENSTRNYEIVNDGAVSAYPANVALMYFWYNFTDIDGDPKNYADAIDWLVELYYAASIYHGYNFDSSAFPYDFTYPQSSTLAQEYYWMANGLQRMYFKMDSLDICIRVFQDSSCEREVTNFYTYFILDDQTAPALLKDSDIKVIDLNNADNGKDKTRIILQFQEPVWVNDGDDLVIEGYANNDSNYKVQFKYAGGSGTNNLYFDLDKAKLKNEYSGINITNVNLKKISSASGNSFISDFSRHGLKVDNNCVKDKIVKLNYDLRIPNLTSVSCSTASSYNNSQNVILKYNSVSNEGTIQYVWKKASDPAPTIDEYVESTAVSGITKTIKSSDGDSTIIKNGKWTLYVRLVSALGKTGAESMGQITVNIDNEAPSIDYKNNDFSIDRGGVNQKTTHTFDFSAVDQYSNISQIKFMYSTTPFTGLGDFQGNTITVFDMMSDDINNEYLSYVAPKTGDTSLMPCHFQVSNFHVNVIDGSQNFYVGVMVLDMAKNQSEVYVHKDTVRFSGLSSFPMTATLLDESTNKFKDFKDMLVVPAGGTIKCTTDSGIEGNPVTDIVINKAIYANGINAAGRTVCVDLADTFDCSWTTDSVNQKCVALVKVPEKDGCYDLNLRATYEYNGSHYIETNTVRVYVYSNTPTANSSENLTNLKDNNGLISKVYMLSTDAKYYYIADKTNSAFGGAITESYTGDSSKPAIFSSEDKAKEYIRFMEMQDVTLLKITSANFASVKQQFGYKLADVNEVIEGEYWIRYKSKNWLPTTNNTNWEYYYYGAGDGTIDWNRLKNTNLDRALTTVTSRIVDAYGSDVYVHDDYYNTDGTLDAYGTPKFDVSQLHVANLKVPQAKSGTYYFVPLDYAADVAMYENSISVSSYSEKGYIMLYGYSFLMDYGIAPDSNDTESLRMNGIRKVFYSDATVTDGEIKQLFPSNGVYNLRDLPESTQQYVIYELGEKGYCQYNVLVDRDPPTVDIFYVKNENEMSITLKKDQHDGYYIFAQHVALQKIEDYLDGDYSYVALFRKRYSAMEYYGTYLPSELDGTVQLEEGNYIMQVYDRSGNNFAVSIFVNNHALDCSVKIAENRYIQLNVKDRTAQEIDTYEVWRDGKLLPYSFMDSQSFYDSGTYTFVVKDQYGNPTWTATQKFERTTPSVTVRYLKDGEDQNFVPYNEKSTDLPLYIQDVGASTYEIYTRTKLRFTYDSTAGYEFAFSGHFANYTSEVNQAGLTTITLTKVADCRLKIWYSKYPTTFVYYDVFADTTAPIVDLTTDVKTYMYDDIEQIKQNCYKMPFGSTLTADSVKYSVVNSERGIVFNKSIVYSNDIIGNITDLSPLKRAVLYVNGRIVSEYVRADSAEKVNSVLNVNVVQSDDGTPVYGNYRIEAEDVIGNTTIIEFTNNDPDTFRIYTDDVLDGAYGKENFVVTLANNSSVCMTVAYGNATPVYKVVYYGSEGIFDVRAVSVGSEYRREVELQYDNCLYEIIPDDLGDQIRNKDMDIITRKKWYPLDLEGVKGAQIYFDSNDVVKIMIPADEKEKVKICVRVETDENSLVAPFYREAVLSTKQSDIVLKTLDGEKVYTNQNETIIYVKDVFYIEPDQNFDEIDLIEVGTSVEGVEYGMNYETMKLTTLKDVAKKFDMGTVYRSGVSLKETDFVENVHYLIHVRNIYGTDTYYYISKSQDFGLDTKAVYLDGANNVYTRENYAETETVRSNSYVELYAYASGFDVVTITKINGTKRTPYVIDDPTINGMTENGYYYVYLNNVGVYEVYFEDIYGHAYTRKIEIGSENIGINKEELFDYNYTLEDYMNMSTIKQDDHTFKNVDIQPHAISADVVYIAVRNGEETRILFNVLSASDRKEFDETALENVLFNGNGTYDIEIRNAYGDCYTRTLYYQSAPLIKVIRQTRTINDDEIGLDDLKANGIWTNASYEITGSQDAILEKNGTRLPLPFSDEYASGASEGKIEYTLRYYDEYGFDFEIPVHIVRSSISLDFDESMNVVKYNNLDITTGDIIVVFKENEGVTCKYSYEGGEYVDYASGTKLQKDGVYSFVVSDRAGNVSTKVIKRDTFVDFSFVNQNTSRKIINGELVNDIVYFSSPASDTSYIKIAILNGVVQEDTGINRMSADGKWEFLIEDAVGNQAYFSFYKVTHEINKISYETPYGYRITSASHTVNGAVLPVTIPYSPEKNCSVVEVEDDGYYEMVMTNAAGEMFTFHFTISTLLPTATLVGCEDKGLCLKEVTLDGLNSGDTIFVYRDGVLVTTQDILAKGDNVVMDEAGEYKVVVKNVAGNEVVYNFTKKFVMNTAGSVLVIVLNVVLAIALFIGILYRTKSKIDG